MTDYSETTPDIQKLYITYCETYEKCMCTSDMRATIHRLSEKSFLERINQEATKYSNRSITRESDIELNYYDDDVDNTTRVIIIGVYKYVIQISYSK